MWKREMCMFLSRRTSLGVAGNGVLVNTVRVL